MKGGPPNVRTESKAMTTTNWLTKDEPDLYRKNTGGDPYSIWVTKMNGAKAERKPARLLAYADKETAHIIYLDGTRDIVRKEQMTARHWMEQASVQTAKENKNG